MRAVSSPVVPVSCGFRNAVSLSRLQITKSRILHVIMLYLLRPHMHSAEHLPKQPQFISIFWPSGLWHCVVSVITAKTWKWYQTTRCQSRKLLYTAVRIANSQTVCLRICVVVQSFGAESLTRNHFYCKYRGSFHNYVGNGDVKVIWRLTPSVRHWV